MIVVMDSQRTINVVADGPVTEVVVASTGMQGPPGAPTIVNGKSGTSITLTASDVGAVPTTAEGAALGVATLDASALVPIAQMNTASLAAYFLPTGSLSSSTPISVATAGVTGVSTSVSRQDHVHPGVDLANAQTVGGVKTFSVSPIVPAPTTAFQAATKAYVDAAISGLTVKSPAATCAAYNSTGTASLPTNTYNNGASGVGATLTGVATGVLTVDGHAVALNDIVMVANEVAQANNGLYLCTVAGAIGVAYVLTRTTNMNTPAEIPGAFTYIETGTTNGGAGYTVAGVGPYTIGTTAIVWTQFSGAGEITAGTGLTKSGNTLLLTNPVSIALGGTGSATQVFITIGGDINGGTVTSPQVTATHLAAALPINQGGTGSTTQPFVDISTTQAAIAGNKTFTGKVSISNSNNAAFVVTGGATGQQLYSAVGSDSTSIAYEAEVTGDTVNRFVVDVNGKMNWGPGGSTARDTNLYRNAVGVLKTDTAFTIGTTLNALSDVQVNGLSLSRGTRVTPTVSATAGTPTSGGTETEDIVWGTYTFTAEAGRRYQVVVDGLLGNGNTVGDLFGLRVRDGGASAPTNTSTVVAESAWYCAATGTTGRSDANFTGTILEATGGTHTLAFFAIRQAGSGIFTPISGSGGTNRELYVLDIGPV